MTRQALKTGIQTLVQNFAQGNFTENSTKLFRALGYKSELVPAEEMYRNKFAEFAEIYIKEDMAFDNQKALTEDWQYVDILFQITDAQLQGTIPMFRSQKIDNQEIYSYLFACIELKEAKYSRSKLAQITREVNKLFVMPALVLFKYGSKLSLAIINRRLNKKDSSRDVLQKVTQIKDIDIQKPHRAHIEILSDLALPQLKEKHSVTNFVALHKAWQKTLDLEELNKQFFKKIANWYFWAVAKSKFPYEYLKEEKPNESPEKLQEIANKSAMIRLLTRLIFVWFLKEKGLIKAQLFEEEQVNAYLASEEEFGAFFEKDQITLSQEDLQKYYHSSYYKAILQNLFFASLNADIKDQDKQFVKACTKRHKDQKHSLNNTYRYRYFFKDEQKALEELFYQIPFLNGGLFDSLQQGSDKNKKHIDTFTNPYENQDLLYVPDRLFFAEETNVFSEELKQIYDVKKKGRQYKVKGIFRILEEYKFTVEENTDLEQDVALDPELLGQVFENLLAYYNPETEKTARKNTGSFYTPRKIVEYMVEQSLLTYLLQALQKDKTFFLAFGEKQTALFSKNQYNKGQTVLESSNQVSKEVEKVLQNLLSKQKTNLSLLGKRPKQIIIRSLLEVKILDPACGSGAFPMGILQKIVEVLNTIDPENKIFKQVLIQKTQGEKEKLVRQLKADREIVQQISDAEIVRKVEQEIEAKIQEIEQNFEDQLKTDDYSRKLYIIQNCIYGVDIQNIAIQISKLRFFLSLIIEQEQGNKDNLGMEPLPNLETKFVTANTLIALEKPKQLEVFGAKIKAVQEEIFALRKQYFTIRSKSKKQKLIEKDKALRQKIANIMQNDAGMKAKDAQKIAQYNLFDQNDKAEWFDMELMFGVKNGFDILIGNPPYVQIQKFKPEQKNLWKAQNYKTYAQTGDVYGLFYEKSYQLLNKQGLLSFITSNKWMRAGYGQKLRKFFAEKTTPLRLIDFGGHQVFETATVDTNILIFSKIANLKEKSVGLKIEKDFDKHTDLYDYFEQNKIALKNLSEDIWTITSAEKQAIKHKIEKVGTPLKDWNISIYRGITTGYNEAFIIDKATKDRLIAEDPNSAEVIKPILRGRDIQRYKANFADLYLICTFPTLKIDIEKYFAVKKHLLSFGRKRLEQTGAKGSRKKTNNKWFEVQDSIAYYQEFEKEKIVWQEISQRSFFNKGEKGVFIPNTAYMLTDYNAYLLALLNSKTIEWFFRNFITVGLGEKGMRFTNQYVEQIPIPQVSPSAQKPFEVLVDKILLLKAEGKDSSALEAEIDSMVYALYDLTGEEIAIVERT